jgi:hypothetical protein
MGWTILGLNPSFGKAFFSSTKHSDWLWGPSSLLFNEYWAFFVGRGRGKGARVNHSPASNAEGKIE